MQFIQPYQKKLNIIMIYHLVGVCDSFDLCKQYIKKELSKQTVIKPVMRINAKENSFNHA